VPLSVSRSKRPHAPSFVRARLTTKSTRSPASARRTCAARSPIEARKLEPSGQPSLLRYHRTTDAVPAVDGVGGAVCAAASEELTRMRTAPRRLIFATPGAIFGDHSRRLEACHVRRVDRRRTREVSIVARAVVNAACWIDTENAVVAVRLSRLGEQSQSVPDSERSPALTASEREVVFGPIIRSRSPEELSRKPRLAAASESARECAMKGGSPNPSSFVWNSSGERST